MALLNQEDFLSKVVSTNLCVGCGACAALAPKQLELTKCDKGHLRPKAKAPLPKQVSRRIAQVCPGAAQRHDPLGPANHPLWGSYSSVQRGWARDAELRHAGASGGALSAFLIALLDHGIVEQVLQVAADRGNPMGNRTVITRDRDGILSASGSRYAPSNILGDVPRILRDGRPTAFVGRPCDVAGLRHWARIEPEIDEVFPVKLSFFCAGTPGEAGAQAILDRLGVAPAALRRMRYRGAGWPGACELEDTRGKTAAMSYDDSWGQVLSRHVQSRCRICADGIGLDADVVFADAWHRAADGGPSFDDAPGESLILNRTAQGDALLQRFSQHIETAPFDIETLAEIQPGQLRRRQELLGRLAGRVAAGRPIPKYRNLNIWQNGKAAPVWQSLRAALGTLRRSLASKAPIL